MMRIPPPNRRIRRRDFVALLAGAMAGTPLAVRAQQVAMPVVGFMSSRSFDDSRYLVAAFLAGLRANGYIEGQNVSVEYRWGNGQYDRLPALAAELVRSHVSVLVATGGEPSVLAT